MGVYNRAPLEVERGQGVRLWSTDGTAYLDCVSGISTNALGHAHPKLVQAVKDQAEKLWHVSNIFKIPGQDALADSLCEKSFADVVFFTNSGTEAIECALKTARKFHVANGQPERIDIYGFDGSFHGRTYGAINAAANPSYTEGFGPPMQGFHQLTWGDKEALKAAFENPTTAAVILEPVQGEGGFNVIQKAAVAWLRELCDEHGILLIADEVQTGFARTGKMFAMEHFGVSPDLMTMAKSMAGGTTLSAVVGRTAIMDAPAPGGLGGTYAGNPLAIAASHAVLDIMRDERLPERANVLGARLLSRLQKLQVTNKTMGDVRGLGAMIACEFVDAQTGAPDADRTKQIQQAALKKGLLLLTCGVDGNVLRFLFPLTIEDAVFEEALVILDDVISA